MKAPLAARGSAASSCRPSSGSWRPYRRLMTGATFTYREVGATSGDLPPGYHHTCRTAPLGHGLELFLRAGEAVMTWEMHRRAGLTVTSDSPRAISGAAVVLGWGVGRLRLSAPCRVVLTVNEPTATGFAYGTLLGHPESGEESFVVRVDDAERVRLDIVAFSRPATWYARAGAPLTGLVQRAVTGRYLAALREG